MVQLNARWAKYNNRAEVEKVLASLSNEEAIACAEAGWKCLRKAQPMEFKDVAESLLEPAAEG